MAIMIKARNTLYILKNYYRHKIYQSDKYVYMLNINVEEILHVSFSTELENWRTDDALAL